MTPSRCRPPPNCTSPRIVVPSAISVLIAAIDCLPLLLPLLPNIVFPLSLAIDGILPLEFLLDATAVAVGPHLSSTRLGANPGGSTQRW